MDSRHQTTTTRTYGTIETVRVTLRVTRASAIGTQTSAANTCCNVCSFRKNDEHKHTS